MKKWYSALLLLIPFLTHIRLLRGDFVWDDASIIIDTSQLVNPFSHSGIPWIHGLYRPIAFVSLQLDYLLWRTNPFGFHLTSLVIHSLSVLLLFLILKRLVKVEIAFFAALLFGIHPAVGEAVGWISCRFDLLAVFFALLSIYCLLLYLEEGRKIIIFAVVVFSLFSVLSKETGIVLALLLPVVYFFCRRGSLKPLCLFAFVLLSILLLFFISLRGNVLARYGNWTEAVVNGLKLFGLYIYKFFSWHYLTPYSTCLFSDLGTTTIVISLVVISLMALSLCLSIKKRQVAGLGIIWFVVVLLPGIYVSLAMGYRLPGADRFLYGALPGLTLLLATISFGMLNKKAIPLFIALTLILIPVSFQRSAIWLNASNLWSYANDTCRGQWTYPLNNLADAELARGRVEEAEVLYQKLVKGIDVKELKCLHEIENMTNLIYGLNRLGKIHEGWGQYDMAEVYHQRAEEEYSRVVMRYPGAAGKELIPANYDFSLYYYNKSLRDKSKEPLSKALERVDLVLQYKHAWLEPQRLKAYILLGLGNCTKAIESLKNSLKIFGRNTELFEDIAKFRNACEGQ